MERAVITTDRKWQSESEDFLKRLIEMRSEILNSKEGCEKSEKREKVEKRLKLPGFLLSAGKAIGNLAVSLRRAFSVLSGDALSVDDLNDLIREILYVTVIYEKSYHREGLNLKGKFFALPLLHQIRKYLGLRFLRERFKRANFFFLAVVSALAELFLEILPLRSASVVNTLTFVFLIVFIVSIYFSISAYERERDCADALLLIEIRLRNR